MATILTYITFQFLELSLNIRSISISFFQSKMAKCLIFFRTIPFLYMDDHKLILVDHYHGLDESLARLMKFSMVRVFL